MPINKKTSWIIGIDEVGRGALAGPVVVAAVALPKNLEFKILVLADWTIVQSASKIEYRNLAGKIKLKLRDSKKLSSKQREVWFELIKNLALPRAIASVSPKIIDKMNISNAANLAAGRAFGKLIKRYKLKTKGCKVFLDGGLYIKNLELKNFPPEAGQPLAEKTKTIIRGDEKIPAISLASIVAKVHRDKLMKKLSKKYPRYDFIHNVGYGTKKHIKAIKKYGLSPIHRRSFYKRILN